jgi:hypothetical protein
VRPALDIRIEELVVVGVAVDRDALGPAVEVALAARLEDGSRSALDGYAADASSLDALADGVAACLHDAIAERLQ